MIKKGNRGIIKGRRRVSLLNDKHRTVITLMVHYDEALTYKQQERSREQLCGIQGCPCNKDLGIHGPQLYDIIHVPTKGWKIKPRKMTLFTKNYIT